VEKKKLETPKEVIGIAKCKNPKCVTNHQPIKTKFATVHEGDKISLKCHYCEKITSIKHAL
jgi:aspartate carbamoyltransferase regulatory subunit